MTRTEGPPPYGRGAERHSARTEVCPCCGSAMLPLPESKPTPVRPPRAARVPLTDEERVQRRRDACKRWYEKTKDERREIRNANSRQYYARNREVLLSQMSDRRHKSNEAKRVAELAQRAPPEGFGLDSDLFALVSGSLGAAERAKLEESLPPKERSPGPHCAQDAPKGAALPRPEGAPPKGETATPAGLE